MTTTDVFWKGEKIGVIVLPTIDNFHLYGAWRPVEGLAVANFAAATQRDDEATIFLGSAESNLQGTVAMLSEAEIEILMRPMPNPLLRRTFALAAELLRLIGCYQSDGQTQEARRKLDAKLDAGKARRRTPKLREARRRKLDAGHPNSVEIFKLNSEAQLRAQLRSST
jgi:thymidine phosphorylase